VLDQLVLELLLQAFFVRANDADRNPAGRRGRNSLIRRFSLFFEFESKESQPILKVASGSPIRSIPPSRIRRSESPASNTANLMLDEPPLIVRMRGLAGFMDDYFVIPQSDRR
jgi:hypothetical protein